MKTALVLSLLTACVAAILAHPLDAERFRRGIADPDAKFRENEIDSSLQELVRSKKSPTGEIFIGKGIQKEPVQTSLNEKKEEVKTSLKDLESEKQGEETIKDDADRSRRQQPFYISPVTIEGVAPNLMFRSSALEAQQLPTKPLSSQPAVVSPFLDRTSVPAVVTHVPVVEDPHHHDSSHVCHCQCPQCVSRPIGLVTVPVNPYPSHRSSQQIEDQVKQLRAFDTTTQQQRATDTIQLQQQVALLQQQMDQQRAVDQMQQLQLELQKQKLDGRSADQIRSADADPDCDVSKLANLQLPQSILRDLVHMEQQRVQKIKDCQSKSDEPQKLEMLSAIVEKEVELLQKQVEMLHKSDADKKKKIDEKKTR